MRASMARPGVLRSVALAPFSLVRGTVGALGRTSSKAPGDNLADQWLDFLIQQAEAEDGGEAKAALPAGDAGGKPASGLAGKGVGAEQLGRPPLLPPWPRTELPGPELPRTPRSPSFSAQ